MNRVLTFSNSPWDYPLQQLKLLWAQVYSMLGGNKPPAPWKAEKKLLTSLHPNFKLFDKADMACYNRGYEAYDGHVDMSVCFFFDNLRLLDNIPFPAKFMKNDCVDEEVRMYKYYGYIFGPQFTKREQMIEIGKRFPVAYLNEGLEEGSSRTTDSTRTTSLDLFRR